MSTIKYILHKEHTVKDPKTGKVHVYNFYFETLYASGIVGLTPGEDRAKKFDTEEEAKTQLDKLEFMKNKFKIVKSTLNQ